MSRAGNLPSSDNEIEETREEIRREIGKLKRQFPNFHAKLEEHLKNTESIKDQDAAGIEPTQTQRKSGRGFSFTSEETKFIAKFARDNNKSGRVKWRDYNGPRSARKAKLHFDKLKLKLGVRTPEEVYWHLYGEEDEEQEDLDVEKQLPTQHRIPICHCPKCEQQLKAQNARRMAKNKRTQPANNQTYTGNNPGNLKTEITFPEQPNFIFHRQEPHAADDNTEQVHENEEQVGASNDWLWEEDYVYNADTDTYITFISAAPKPLVVPGAKHRAMKQAYSNWDGQPASVNQICRSFGIPRTWFEEYKRKHGWTHDSEPFTTEELLSKPEDELIEEALQAKRQSVYQKFEKAKWKETQEAADKWWKLEQTFLLPLQEIGATRAPREKPQRLNLVRIKTDFVAVVAPVDLHYGKKGWINEVGEEYNREIARERLFQQTRELVSDIAKQGQPEYIIVTAADDWLHMDNYQGTTTAGTPQDIDGTPAQIFDEGCDLAAEYFDLLLQIAPVRIIYVPDNHSKLLGQALVKYLTGYYRNIPDAVIERDMLERKYHLYGNTLLGFGHVPIKNAASQMAAEAPELWGQSKVRCFFFGDKHKQSLEQDDKDGVLRFISPSLSGVDRWHHQRGFNLQRKAIGAYIIEKTRGLTHDIYAPVTTS